MIKKLKQELIQPQKSANLSQRVQRLQKLLREKSLDALLISKTANRFYLTGWQGDSESGFLLVTRTTSFLFTDSRYTEHAAISASHFKIVEILEDFGSSIKEVVEKEGLQKIGFESSDLSVSNFKKLRGFLRPVRFVPTIGLIEQLRAVKDDQEISSIRKVAKMTDRAFEHIIKFIKPGLTEREVSWELSSFMRSLGAQSDAWSPLIVAAGPNSSMPHHTTGETKIQRGDMVLVDFGANLGGYVSDMTRVVFVGSPDKEKKEIYETILRAQKLGIDTVKPGIKASLIDRKVKDDLEKVSKYCYRHGLGHGVGLEVHESPSLSSRSKSTLEERNIITIEPGIYIPGWGGVRIEDMVLVSESGREVLTKAPKELPSVVSNLN